MDALSIILQMETGRRLRGLIDGLFEYNYRRDCYVLKRPDITEYTPEALARMAYGDDYPRIKL